MERAESTTLEASMARSGPPKLLLLMRVKVNRLRGGSLGGQAEVSGMGREARKEGATWTSLQQFVLM